MPRPDQRPGQSTPRPERPTPRPGRPTPRPGRPTRGPRTRQQTRRNPLGQSEADLRGKYLPTTTYIPIPYKKRDENSFFVAFFSHKRQVILCYVFSNSYASITDDYSTVHQPSNPLLGRLLICDLILLCNFSMKL